MKFQPHSDQAKFNKPYELKPTVIPANMIMVVDTREQRPLFTKLPKGLTIVRNTLTDGDYSIVGHESRFVIERKFLGDLYPFCSSERDRTITKMKRLLAITNSGGWVSLVIEAKESDAYKYQDWTRVSPECVRGALISFSLRYKVHVYFSGNRENSARYILDHACKFYNIIHEV